MLSRALTLLIACGVLLAGSVLWRLTRGQRAGDRLRDLGLWRCRVVTEMQRPEAIASA